MKDEEKLVFNLKQRINLVQRIGRFVIAAHEDSFLTIWDVNKSSKRPVKSLQVSGPLRFFTVTDDGVIVAGSVIDKDNNHLVRHPSHSWFRNRFQFIWYF